MSKKSSSKRFASKDLNRFRSMLEKRKKELTDTESDLEDEALVGLSEETTDEISHVRTHPADLGSEEAEQDLDLSLAEGEITEVQDIEDALLRIQNEKYGICEDCAGEISFARLEAMPYTRYCASCERRLETERRRRFEGEGRSHESFNR